MRVREIIVQIAKCILIESDVSGSTSGETQVVFNPYRMTDFKIPLDSGAYILGIEAHWQCYCID